MTPKQLSELGLIVDRACDFSDEQELLTIIGINAEYVETLNCSVEKATLYYFLANAWSGLRNIRHQENESSVWNYEQKEVFKEIYYFRKAIQQANFKDLDLSIQLAIYVNLGNSFSHYGRTINAIKYFDKAIALKFWDKNVLNHPNYFMALINKGFALEYYSKLDYDDGHKEFFIKFAYKNFKEAISIINKYLEKNDLDKEYYQEKKDNILARLKCYEEQFFRVELEDIDYFLNYKTNFSKNEDEYRKWCLSHRLFLNSLNDLGNYDISTHDPLNLPNLTTKINEGFPKIVTNFNQLKQEYIFYRYLLFEGLREKTPKYYDKETSITNDYDYNLYNINIEKIKIAFRGFYSIFDKIAYFMNEYFGIGLHENSVDFRRIWYDLDKQKKPINIKSIFNQSENLVLRGLYLISKDLFYSDESSKEYLRVLEPNAEQLGEIRNHLEHKFISIKLLDIEVFKEVADRKRSFYILEDDLEAKTLHLAQLAREAIIYLSFGVHIEERKRAINPDLYLEMPLEIMRRI